MAGWNGFEIRNAGLRALAGQEALGVCGDEHHGDLEGPQQFVDGIQARRAIGELNICENEARLLGSWPAQTASVWVRATPIT